MAERRLPPPDATTRWILAHPATWAAVSGLLVAVFCGLVFRDIRAAIPLGVAIATLNRFLWRVGGPRSRRWAAKIADYDSEGQ